MNNIYILSFIVSIIYFLIKFVETKYKNQEKQDNNNWLKALFKDAVLVAIVSMCAQLLVNQFHQISSYKTSPDVFVGEPNF